MLRTLIPRHSAQRTHSVVMLSVCGASLIWTLLAMRGRGEMTGGDGAWLLFLFIIAALQIHGLLQARRAGRSIADTPSEATQVATLTSELVELRAERDRLNALLEGRFTDLRLARFENGELDLRSGLVPVLTEHLAQMLQGDPDAPRAEPANYIEMTVQHREMGRLTLTLQRASGKTPHQLRREAEDRLAALTQPAT